ncbi:MAG: hypothetical protein CMJ78_02845 [Planctomycetaceae bacterium]|nr:hypothetical protein [Planctomycetaceae bacterium]
MAVFRSRRVRRVVAGTVCVAAGLGTLSADQPAQPKQQPEAKSLIDFVTGVPVSRNVREIFKPELLRSEFANAPEGSIKRLASEIKFSEVDADNRTKAVKYLGTVNPAAYPNSHRVLVHTLSTDPSEQVRFVAAQSLGSQFQHSGHQNSPIAQRRAYVCEEGLANLAIRAYIKDAQGKFVEPSLRVRRQITASLDAYNPAVQWKQLAVSRVKKLQGEAGETMIAEHTDTKQQAASNQSDAAPVIISDIVPVSSGDTAEEVVPAVKESKSATEVAEKRTPLPRVELLPAPGATAKTSDDADSTSPAPAPAAKTVEADAGKTEAPKSQPKALPAVEAEEIRQTQPTRRKRGIKRRGKITSRGTAKPRKRSGPSALQRLIDRLKGNQSSSSGSGLTPEELIQLQELAPGLLNPPKAATEMADVDESSLPLVPALTADNTFDDGNDPFSKELPIGVDPKEGQTPLVPLVETPVEETPAVEEPVAEPAEEKTVVETPVVEAPVEEETVAETPVVETPAVKFPVIEIPVPEPAPIVEVPSTELPAIEAPIVEGPATKVEPVAETVPETKAPIETVSTETKQSEKPTVTPAKEVAVDEAPVKQAPVEQPTVEEVPAEPAPVVEEPESKPIVIDIAAPAPEEAPAVAVIDPSDFPLVGCFRGYCPVATAQRKLEKAKPEFATVYKGQRYEFANIDALAEFERNPELYAPVMGGIDVVTWVKRKEKKTGYYVVEHKGRYFWFSTLENCKAFYDNPSKFAGEAK